MDMTESRLQESTLGFYYPDVGFTLPFRPQSRHTCRSKKLELDDKRVIYYSAPYVRRLGSTGERSVLGFCIGPPCGQANQYCQP